MSQDVAVKKRAMEIQEALFSNKSLEQIKAALPEIGITPDRLARIAFTAISRDEKLLKCSWTSLIRAVIQCAQYGLVPDGRQAHLVPYGQDCTLIIDYKGLVTLIRRSPNVSNMFAFTIHKNDQYEVTLGTNPDIKHSLPKDGGDRGEPIAAYSVIRYKDGGFDFDVMSVSDVETVRDHFAQKNFKGEFSKAWRFSFEEMMKKTVIRRHSKTADISYNVAEAIENDIKAEGGDGQGSIDADFSEIDQDVVGFDDTFKDFDPALVAKFVQLCAQSEKVNEDIVKSEAMKDVEGFKTALTAWIGKNTKATIARTRTKKEEPPAQTPTPDIDVTADGRIINNSPIIEAEAKEIFTDALWATLEESFPQFPQVTPDEIIMWTSTIGNPFEILREAGKTPAAAKELIFRYLHEHEIEPHTVTDFGGIERLPNQKDESTCTMEQMAQVDAIAKANGFTGGELTILMNREMGIQRMVNLKYGQIPELVAKIKAAKSA